MAAVYAVFLKSAGEEEMPHKKLSSPVGGSTSAKAATLVFRVMFAPIWLIGSLLVSISMWVSPIRELPGSRVLQASSEGSNSGS